MPKLPVPLFTPIYRNVDNEELSDESYELVDGYTSDLGFSVKRPGLQISTAISGAIINKPIDQLFWWRQKEVALAVCDGQIYKITLNNTGVVSSTQITGLSTLSGGAQPVFCTGVNSNVSTPTTYALVANGANIYESHGTGLSVSNFAVLADADAPTTVSHVDFIDGYVVATTGKGFFQYADVNAPTTWSAASFASAMRNPDNIRALKVFRRQIYLFGDETTEVWENDGSNPFSPAPGGFYDVGIIAPYSVVTSDNGIYWLGHSRRFVGLENGAIRRISTPFDKEISQFSSVDDCSGYRVEINGKVLLLFNFVSEERSLVFDTSNNTWSEWTYWDAEIGQYANFRGKSYCYCPKYGIHLMGDRTKSILYIFTEDNSYDWTDDGVTPIRFRRVTGHIDHGTNAFKRCKELTIRAKRGAGVYGGGIDTEASFQLRWNDDNGGWSNEVTVSLGKLGDRETIVRCFPFGVYRTRQYEIVMTSNSPVTFGKAEADIDILG